MKNESGLTDSLSRRSLLGHAVGVAGIIAALGSTGQADAQMQPPGDSGAARVRDSFDFGWKFFKGDAPGAQQPNFADANWKGVDLPHDWSIEGPFSEQPGSAFAFARLPGPWTPKPTGGRPPQPPVPADCAGLGNPSIHFRSSLSSP